MKDFFDIMVLATTFDFEGNLVGSAIQETFVRRGTEIEAEPVCFTKEFAQDAAKQTQWNAFVRRSLLAQVPADFSEVVDRVRKVSSASSNFSRRSTDIRSPIGACCEVREISGPQNKGISDNETSDQKAIHSRIQSPGRRTCGFGKTSGGSGRRP